MIQSGFMAPPGRSARPPLGQHFLASAGTRERILVEFLRPAEEDRWLEIGPGHGEITLPLASRCRLVVAVERDAELASALEGSSPGPNLHVLNKDILAISFTALAAHYETPKWRVYGSLPYYITSPILHRLFEDIACIRDAHVIVQKEVAQRLTARPGSRDYGYLTVATQFHARSEMLLDLPRNEFKPPPRVDSALVCLTPEGETAGVPQEERARFLSFIQTCFRQKRKTLRNNLVGRYPADSIKGALKEENLPPLCRAEELPIATLGAIFRRLAPVR